MNHQNKYAMGIQDFFTWRSQTATANMPATEEDDLAADVDEPPDSTAHHFQPSIPVPYFHREEVRPQHDRKESLLTKALHTTPEHDTFRPDMHIKTDLLRRRSLISNTSLASTMDLTSDGGLTSPARTNTPSPPFPNTTYTSFAPFSLGPKATNPVPPPMATAGIKDPANALTHDVIVSVSPRTTPTPAVETPKRRCITFACGPGKPTAPPTSQVAEEKVEPEVTNTEPPKRRCTIKFACPGPRPSEKAKEEKAEVQLSKPAEVSRPVESQRRNTSGRSPSLTRRARPQSSSSRSHRDSTGTVRRASQSPVAVRTSVRTSKPKYIVASESDLQLSDATRFNEFASEMLQEDDWIRKDAAEDLIRMKKLTINDTLMKENAIRQLGNEAEEEALEDEEDDDNDNGYDSDDENRDEDEDDNDDDDDATFNGSDDEEDASDGNETDNEAGFADSDDESDGEYQFWTPGRSGPMRHTGEASIYRASAHRTASTSSIDSLEHLKPIKEANGSRRSKPSRRIKIRPGTPDLPDSTDFVCGTLDEDRPLEDAYISCVKARQFHHKVIPQDIDPSFPTSDPEEEEDENDIIEVANDSEEHIWLHGKFEDSDSERHGRRRSAAQGHSPRRFRSPPPPKRLHSPPPPARRRLHSPPPRKLFGHSPRCIRSPPPARTIPSPTASPTSTSGAITFAELGSRAGVTHTKSLPRTPNAFCRQYRASRLAAANGNDPNDGNDAHVRGAIDIVKGLEQKRQRRKEKFYQKQCNRARKGQPERRPQPGKGAERMKELGLLMAGKVGQDQNPYILSA